MTPEQELKLSLLHLSGGDILHAKEMLEWMQAGDTQPPTPPRAMSDAERAEFIQRIVGDEVEQAASLTSGEPTALHPYREASDDPARKVHEYYYGSGDDGESADIATLTVAEPEQEAAA